MSSLRKLINNIKKLTPERQERELLRIIKKNKKVIAQFNVDQMFAGIESTGKRIKPPYTEGTKKIKKRKGQPSNRVTLRDKGDFHNEVFIDADKAPVLFFSLDSKTSNIVEKYGEEIFGLTKKNKDLVYKVIVGEDYKKFIRDILFL